MVVRWLPKPKTGVRFSYPAPNDAIRHSIEKILIDMLRESDYVKIRVTVPHEASERVRQALGDVGAGHVGNYSYCSFSYAVEGQFTPNNKANPAIGKAGKREIVQEIMIEAVCHKDKVTEVMNALRRAHPYEEPAIDIMPRYEVE